MLICNFLEVAYCLGGNHAGVSLLESELLFSLPIQLCRDCQDQLIARQPAHVSFIMYTTSQTERTLCIGGNFEPCGAQLPLIIEGYQD